MSSKQNNARLHPENQKRLDDFKKANNLETHKEFIIFVLDKNDGEVLPLSENPTDVPHCIFKGTHESLGAYVMCKGTKIHIAQCITRQKRYVHGNYFCKPVETDKLKKTQRRMTLEEKAKKYTCINCKRYKGCIRPPAEDGFWENKAAMPTDYICKKFWLNPKMKHIKMREVEK